MTVGSPIPEVAQHTDGEAAQARDVLLAMTLTDVALSFMEVIARIIRAWQTTDSRHGEDWVCSGASEPERMQRRKVYLSAAECGKRLNVLAALRATG